MDSRQLKHQAFSNYRLFKRSIEKITLFFAFALFPSLFLFSQTWEHRANLFVEFADSHHISPRKCDDEFSKDLFESFFDEVDPGKNYFTKEVISSFDKYKLDLDELCKTGKGEFLEEVSKSLKIQALKVDSLVQSILESPTDFTTKEKIPVGPKTKDEWPANDAEWVTLWKLRLKQSILLSLYDQYRDSTQMTAEKIKTALEGEPAAREKLKKYVFKRIHLRLDHPADYAGAAFMNALASIYDPHSNYFTPTEKDDFESLLSTENLSLGITFEESDNGELKIFKIVPGGPAWRSGNLHKGDVLIKIVTPDGEEKNLSLSGLDELEEILKPIGKGIISLTVRKVNGKLETVSLSKEEMETEESTVRSLVLDGHIKVGYIHLPGFYTEWDDPVGKGCATDVAKELIKLKKENVNGVILDLRFNGGGSMKEALELAGIFIDAGPIWISKDREGNLKTVKDQNQGAIYSGPLMILQNGGSASASEFLADALQDYHRAIIAGTPSFGKGTAQDIKILDEKHFSVDEGYVKMTSAKYYRLDGSSHQKVGVTPDVFIEDPLKDWFNREEEYDHCLPSDSVVKKVYFTPLQENDFSGIQQRSQLRMDSNPYNKKIKEATEAVYRFYKIDTTISLFPAAYFSWLEKIQYYRENLDEATDAYPGSDLEVKNTGFDQALLNIDEFEREAQKELQENIRKDLYLREAILIFEDFIQP